MGVGGLVVGQAALRLPGEMLEALIAHQVGHRRLAHAPLLSLAHLFMLPCVGADRLLSALGRANVVAFRAVRRVRGFLLLSIPLVLLFAVRVALLIPVAGARLAMTEITRRADFAADDFAARLGYAQPLSAALGLIGAEDVAGTALAVKRWRLAAPASQRITRLARSSGVIEVPATPGLFLGQ
jgi:Zn-dependent protease with chaperone function